MIISFKGNGGGGSSYELPIATEEKLGGIKATGYVYVDEELGTLYPKVLSTFDEELPDPEDYYFGDLISIEDGDDGVFGEWETTPTLFATNTMDFKGKTDMIYDEIVIMQGEFWGCHPKLVMVQGGDIELRRDDTVFARIAQGGESIDVDLPSTAYASQVDYITMDWSDPFSFKFYMYNNSERTTAGSNSLESYSSVEGHYGIPVLYTKNAFGWQKVITITKSDLNSKADKQVVTPSGEHTYYDETPIPEWNSQGVIIGSEPWGIKAGFGKLNGDYHMIVQRSGYNSPTLFAPTAAGESGQMLLATGGAPSWSTYKVVFISQTAYDALETKDSTTFYFITGD